MPFGAVAEVMPGCVRVVDMDKQQVGSARFHAGYNLVGRLFAACRLLHLHAAVVLDDAAVDRRPVAHGAQHCVGVRLPDTREDRRQIGVVVAFLADAAVGQPVDLRRGAQQHGAPVLGADGRKHRQRVGRSGARRKNRVHTGRGSVLAKAAHTVDADDHDVTVAAGGSISVHFCISFAGFSCNRLYLKQKGKIKRCAKPDTVFAWR